MGGSILQEDYRKRCSMMQPPVSSQWCEPGSLRSCLGGVAAVSRGDVRPRFPPGRMAWLNDDYSSDRL